jgi:hypothetical protein
MCALFMPFWKLRLVTSMRVYRKKISRLLFLLTPIFSVAFRNRTNFTSS